MSECMTFPDTVEEFMDSYKIVDTEQVYTNGTEMVPIYRMRQWFQHEPERKKGKWIRITQGSIPEIYICPFCKRTIKDAGIDSLVQIRYPFCHCGADMREEN